MINKKKSHERKGTGGTMDANSGPVWGAARRTGAFTTTATVETFLWASSPFVSLRHTSDPATLGLAPGPVTEEHTSEPEGVRPRLLQHRLGNAGKDCGGPTTECRLTEAGAAGSQATPTAHAGLDSRGAGRTARRHPVGAELVVLRNRLVGTERFLKARRPKFAGKRNEGRRSLGMGTCRGLTS